MAAPATQDILWGAFQWASQYQSIQAAVTAAGPKGAVMIPPNYPGTDLYTNPYGIVILDFRPGRLAADPAHGGRAVNYGFMPTYGGLGLTMQQQPTYLGPTVPPFQTTPLGWLTSSSVFS